MFRRIYTGNYTLIIKPTPELTNNILGGGVKGQLEGFWFCGNRLGSEGTDSVLWEPTRCFMGGGQATHLVT